MNLREFFGTSFHNRHASYTTFHDPYRKPSMNKTTIGGCNRVTSSSHLTANLLQIPESVVAVVVAVAVTVAVVVACLVAVH